jgi:hypothetical protein
MTGEPMVGFKNTGAGIETLRPYEAKVRVKEMKENDSSQLKIFIGDDLPGNGRAISEIRKYG